MTENRRSVFRKNAFTIGSVVLAHGEAGCLVWDVTETGAQIEVEGDQVVPATFLLRLIEGAEPRPAAVAWRRGRRIGLTFEPVEG
ncbi:pilus assembly protein PilZ [Methylobacterium sp. PvR107]|uniref:pilus assembly protein PilZ n=1 Tax=Methylobacterium sp. PvR107 TaxID=2806597 RepID=UPI001AE6AF46|nr:pilus assembly protein PilZ [Methylobacterium sp. PvR107]MBP1182519.1 hypothetical protein [Methylobacterium sp. PvR107]